MGNIGDNWNFPDEKFKRQLAMDVIPYIYFIDKKTVDEIKNENINLETNYKYKFTSNKINMKYYFWENSACSFPGVRRYRGGEKKGEAPVQTLQTDDNTYPKHIWYFLQLGRNVKIEKKSGWTLAHILDHKVYYQQRINDYFRNNPQLNLSDKDYLSGLYTSIPNTVYIPSVLAGITDENEYLRDLLVMISQNLYIGTTLFPFGLNYNFTNITKTNNEYSRVRHLIKTVNYNKNNFKKFIDFRNNEYSLFEPVTNFV